MKLNQMSNTLRMLLIACLKTFQQRVDDLRKTGVRQPAIRHIKLNIWVNSFGLFFSLVAGAFQNFAPL